MILVKTIEELGKLLKNYRSAGESIGFVPTMGALHPGHISLVSESRKNEGVTVCSIFVNPTQFNNPADFDKYPVTIEKDINVLEQAGCTVLFVPATAEMYPANDPVLHYDLGFIETILEGKYRPGHFQGVCRIVDKLLNAVKPDTLFLGRKDYQQCMVIHKMIGLQAHQTQLQVCDTVREADGLAMSSRNMRLNKEDRQTALHIIKILRSIQSNLKPGDLSPLKKVAFQHLEENGFKSDYVEIADAVTLEPVTTWDGKQPLVALAAAFLNEVRLIDNLVLTTGQNA
ncbi:MAG: pantoate--beta-alanine ligase [Rhizobacter sp.]|nr:pantoate--beta-alanine ligase [Ferruginibacter sp.]